MAEAAMNVYAPVKDAEVLHDLAWWAAERERVGTDWRGILPTVLRDLKVVTPCDVCGCEPCQLPTFCGLAREADARAHQQRQSSKPASPRPTPALTVEAIKQTVRDRGVAALKEPDTRERLGRCDVSGRAEIDKWLTRFKGAAR
jgi:hypothetical protein